jgi:predicted CoA-substrate-specific enzyme activase
MQKLYCGVDIGASAAKLVLLDESREVLARTVRYSGVDYSGAARGLLAQALDESGAAGEVARTVSTGYGRDNVDFADDSKTEIHCHGVGCYHLVPREIVIVDIGGQDNKVIHLGADGRRLDFKMNRKCAAGTGAFIEEIAQRLRLDVSELEPLAASTGEAVQLGSFCTVFTKTEILAHLRRGAPVAEIVRGAFVSVILRITEMAPMDGNVVLTGGVAAYNPTIADIFSKHIGRPVTVPPFPQFTGALGAALVAWQQDQSAE